MFLSHIDVSPFLFVSNQWARPQVRVKKFIMNIYHFTRKYRLSFGVRGNFLSSPGSGYSPQWGPTSNTRNQRVSVRMSPGHPSLGSDSVLFLWIGSQDSWTMRPGHTRTRPVRRCSDTATLIAGIWRERTGSSAFSSLVVDLH